MAWQPQAGPPPGFAAPPPFQAPAAPATTPGAAGVGYVVSDPARIRAEQDRLQKRGGGQTELGDYPWVEMPFPDRPFIGCQVRVLIRILPARADRGVAEYWLRTYRHEIREGKQLKETHACVGAGCEMCSFVKSLFASRDEDTVELAKSIKRKERLYLQCAMLENLQGHYVEADDGHGGKVKRFRPALFGYGSKLQIKLTSLTITRGCSLDHPDNGLNIQVSKSKTGPADMNVDYDALDVGLPGPMPPEFRPLLDDLCDLRILVKQPDPRAISEAIRLIREKQMVTVGSTQVPTGYPGASYPPAGFGVPPGVALGGTAFPFVAGAPQNGPLPPYTPPQAPIGPPQGPPPGFPPPMTQGVPPAFPGGQAATPQPTPQAPSPAAAAVAELERQLLGR